MFDVFFEISHLYFRYSAEPNWHNSPAELKPPLLRGIFAYSSKNISLSYSLDTVDAPLKITN